MLHTQISNRWIKDLSEKGKTLKHSEDIKKSDKEITYL